MRLLETSHHRHIRPGNTPGLRQRPHRVTIEVIQEIPVGRDPVNGGNLDFTGHRLGAALNRHLEGCRRGNWNRDAAHADGGLGRDITHAGLDDYRGGVFADIPVEGDGVAFGHRRQFRLETADGQGRTLGGGEGVPFVKRNITSSGSQNAVPHGHIIDFAGKPRGSGRPLDRPNASGVDGQRPDGIEGLVIWHPIDVESDSPGGIAVLNPTNMVPGLVKGDAQRMMMVTGGRVAVVANVAVDAPVHRCLVGPDAEHRLGRF